METEKRCYSPPELVTYGDLDKLTQGASDGNFLDATFVVGTPKSQLTFS